VVPWPWGLFAIVGGAALEIGESLALVKWSRRRKAAVGAEALVGQKAVVATSTQVRVAGELWEARSDAPLRVGEEVMVREVDGLTLVVEGSRRSARRLRWRGTPIRPCRSLARRSRGPIGVTRLSSWAASRPTVGRVPASTPTTRGRAPGGGCLIFRWP